jgi:hypothetical protein
MFILRAAFWLSIVVLLLPADPGTDTPPPTVGAFEAFGAAQATIGDLTSFCHRNPGVCTTGSNVFQVFAHKVRYGTDILRGYWDGEEPTATVDTLTSDDLRPAWRGPTAPDGVV